MVGSEPTAASDFIRDIIVRDKTNGKWDDSLVTRFPPEPNGYLHIGHAKAACLNFGIAQEFGGVCHLRFDDTNPEKEQVEYVESIKQDVQWLGWDWGDKLYFTSDYFEQLYEFALRLVESGKAYVDDLSQEEIRKFRGSLTKPGKDSPYRDRKIIENIDLFKRMKAGEFQEGSCVLRAKIDMESPNINMRDPVLYRILDVPHHRTGRTWCIYPMYDFAHGQSDSLEGVTHSLCTMEYEDHRPLYNWFLDNLDIYHPEQTEFARLNLSHTVLSKRKLVELVEGGHVDGWDDPRMPTLAGMRRRGYTPVSIRKFCERIGVAKRNNLIDVQVLEHAVREDLNLNSPRVMAVLNPLKVVLENYPEGEFEDLDALDNPEDPNSETRKVSFGREIYIERDDFLENPMKKFYRLSPGREVRLRYGYLITCKDVIKDPHTGEVIELICSYDPATRGGQAPDGRKVRGTMHWVAAKDYVEAEVRLYQHLFKEPNPPDGAELVSVINPDSLQKVTGCKMEASLSKAKKGDRFQFERLGYFVVDECYGNGLVFNRTVTLRDSWGKITKKQS